MGTDPDSRHSRTVAALVSLLFGTVLLATSGCATAWPLAGQVNAPPAKNAVAVTVTDSTARVRANAAGDLVPVDAPAAVSGTARIQDSPAASTSPRDLASETVTAEPARRRPAGFGQVFRRLEAALDDTDRGPSPPPPPMARMTGPPEVSHRAAFSPIETVGGSGSLIPPSRVPIREIATEAAVLERPAQLTGSLKPSTATAAVVRLPDVIDWSGNEGTVADSAPAAVLSPGTVSNGVDRGQVPWWITVIGLVAMGGLIGLSRRLGWPSVSPLE